MPSRDPTRRLLRHVWDGLGGDPDLLELVDIVGEPTGLLTSTLPAIEAMVAAVSASTLSASVLDAARQGTSPARVSVDAEHVALAARSERYARAEGTPATPATDLFAPLSRFWPTADGWLRLHGNYPWHRDRALTVLECEERPERVGDAVRGWRGEELETALHTAGAVGFAVRSFEAWAEHAQGRAVAGLPPVECTVGNGAGRPLGDGRAAAGARVLDLTRVIAGPVATRTLAAWGADVLRLDSPRLPELPAGALDTLPGKRSALVDFAEPAGRARLEELLGSADIVVQGYRPGALARFGLDADELTDRHPQLSVVTLSAWSTAGPWACRRGFDSLVQCPTGIATAEGGDETPGALPAQVLDHATGYLAAAAALLALAGVERGEPPRAARLSLAQTAQWLTSGGIGEPAALRGVPVERHLVELAGPGGRVRVIGPPGQCGDLRPGWSSTTELGADDPSFRSPVGDRR